MQNHNFKISVIIPAYNISKIICRAIDSILAQSFQPLEIIVVDDGSSDDTADYVKSYGDKVRYIYQQNAGDGPARNAGVKAAHGNWLAFLDHDDEWLPERLEKQIILLQKNPQLKWCCGNYYNQIGSERRSAGNQQKLQAALNGKDYFENYFTAWQQYRFAHITGTMLIAREVFDKVGLFDNVWQRCADLDMWWRISYLYPQIGYTSEPLHIMHLDAQQGLNAQLTQADRNGKDARKLLKKHLALARANNCMEIFEPFASRFIKKRLRTTLFYGLQIDTYETLHDFKNLIPLHLRIGAYTLAAIPKTSSAVLRAISRLKHKLGFKGILYRK